MDQSITKMESVPSSSTDCKLYDNGHCGHICPMILIGLLIVIFAFCHLVQYMRL